MPRIFLPADIAAGTAITITGERAHYLSAVLRCRQGDAIIITGCSGQSFASRVLSITKKEVCAEIIKELTLDAESGLHIILLQGLLKGDKMDLVIQKTTELGVNRIIPIVTERSQLRETRKLARWRKIAEEAAKQSGRHIIPDISAPENFVALLRQNQKTVPGIIFWEESSRPLKTIFGKRQETGKIVLVSGPEGGFSSAEVEMAGDSGFEAVSLGRRILRAETAAITAVSIVQYELGDLGA